MIALLLLAVTSSSGAPAHDNTLSTAEDDHALYAEWIRQELANPVSINTQSMGGSQWSVNPYVKSRAHSQAGRRSSGSGSGSSSSSPTTIAPTWAPHSAAPTNVPTDAPTAGPTVPPTFKTTQTSTHGHSHDSSVNVVDLVVALLSTAVALAAAAALSIYIFLQCRQRSDAVEDIEAAKIRLDHLFEFDLSEDFAIQMPTQLIKNQEFECVINPKTEVDEAAMDLKVAEDGEAKQRALVKISGEKAAADEAVDAAKAKLVEAQNAEFKQFKARDENGNQQFKTRTVDGDLNPQYNEKFDFDTKITNRTAGSDHEGTFVLTVFDEDTVSDSVMATYSIPFSQLKPGENQNFDLLNEYGNPGDHGTIVISVKPWMTEEEEAAAAEATEAEDADENPPEWFSGGVTVVSVTVVSCSGLTNDELVGTSDPYVVVTLKIPQKVKQEAPGADAEDGEHLVKVVEQYEKGLLTDDEFQVAKKIALVADQEALDAKPDVDVPKSRSRRPSVANAAVAAAQRAVEEAEAKQEALALDCKALEEGARHKADPKPPIGSPIRHWKPAKMRTPFNLRPKVNRDDYDD